MAKRFGRNQRRKMQERIRELEGDHDLAFAAIHHVREAARIGLGFNCTFVDDDMKVITGLAQRAVLAGLASDAHADMQKRFSTAAEQHRDAHEKALGRSIAAR